MLYCGHDKFPFFQSFPCLTIIASKAIIVCPCYCWQCCKKICLQMPAYLLIDCFVFNAEVSVLIGWRVCMSWLQVTLPTEKEKQWKNKYKLKAADKCQNLCWYMLYTPVLPLFWVANRKITTTVTAVCSHGSKMKCYLFCDLGMQNK